MAEKAKFDGIKARALGIAIESNLTDARSIAEVFAAHGVPTTPKTAFDDAAPLLVLRLRGNEAVELGEAAEPMLRAVHAANTLYSYLDIRKHQSKFYPYDHGQIAKLSKVLQEFTDDARAALESVLYPEVQQSAHAAS